MKNGILNIIGNVLYFYVSAFKRNRPTVIYYHRVIGKADTETSVYFNPYICITKNLFRYQCSFLSRYANVISENDFLDYFRKGSLPSPFPTLITFDDGYRDNYVNAFAVLKEFDLSATIFLTTGMMGRKCFLWWDYLFGIISQIENRRPLYDAVRHFKFMDQFQNLCSKYTNGANNATKLILYQSLSEILKYEKQETINEFIHLTEKYSDIDPPPTQRRNFLNWEEISEMALNKINFGSHTISHPNMLLLDENNLISELSASKRHIESKIGPVRSFSYPYGIYSSQTEHHVAEAGYDIAFATQNWSSPSSRYAIPRSQIKQPYPFNNHIRFSPRRFRVECSGFINRFKQTASKVRNKFQ